MHSWSQKSSIINNLGSVLFVGNAEEMPRQEDSAGSYGGIRYVKGRPVVRTRIEVQEVNNRSIADPVYQVSECSAEYQRDSPYKRIAAAAGASIKIKEAAESDNAYYLEKYVSPFTGPCHKSKSSPRVGYISNIKKSLQNRSYFMELEVGDHYGLADLVCKYNQKNREQKGSH